MLISLPDNTKVKIAHDLSPPHPHHQHRSEANHEPSKPDPRARALDSGLLEHRAELAWELVAEGDEGEGDEKEYGEDEGSGDEESGSSEGGGKGESGEFVGEDA